MDKTAFKAALAAQTAEITLPGGATLTLRQLNLAERVKMQDLMRENAAEALCYGVATAAGLEEDEIEALRQGDGVVAEYLAMEVLRLNALRRQDLVGKKKPSDEAGSGDSAAA